MEFAILFILSLVLILYNNWLRRETEEGADTKPVAAPQPKPVKRVEKVVVPQKNQQGKIEEKVVPAPKEVRPKRKLNKEGIPVVNPKEALVNSFKDGKDLSNARIYSDGKVIVASDDKKIYVFSLNSLFEKSPKSFTKNVPSDVIADVTYSEGTKSIAVALKNSKEIIFYELAKSREDNKIKLQKIEKVSIKSDHQFEINQIAYSRDGVYLATTGVNEDTQVHIYNAKNLKKAETIDINEIQNIRLSFSPDDRFITVSTYMYEIAVIEFKRSTKFNKNNNTEEVTTTLQKKRSIGGIKVPILHYDFSNEPNYFVVSSSDNKIKIFQAFAPNFSLEDSKPIFEIDVDFEDPNFLPQPELVSMYVSESKQNNFEAVVACSSGNNLYIFNQQGQILRFIPQAHDSDIINLKVVKDSDSNSSRDVYVVSISRDGKVNIFRAY